MKIFLSFFLIFLTIGVSLSQEVKNPENFPKQKEKLHTFYLIGDLGADSTADSFPSLSALKKILQTQEDRATEGKRSLIFLGDNFTRDVKLRWNEELNELENIIDMLVFVPGENEWTGGVDGLKEIENALEEDMENNRLVIPKPGCAFEFIDISEKVHLIVLDSQWFLEDWDKHPLVNDDCPEIKSRAAFFEEFETELKKNQNKTTIVALHHPLISNGLHGGRNGWSSFLNPKEKRIAVPIVGQIVNLLRSSGGTSYLDANNPVYSSLVDRMETIAGKWGRVVFVSGHDRSLQYLEKDHLKQIISGSGLSTSYVRNDGKALFSDELEGFAILDVFRDGSSWVRFYSGESGSPVLVYQKELFPRTHQYLTDTLSSNFPATIKASVYRPGETERTKFYRALWGERYRQLYEKQIEVPVANLKTLYGGLTPMRMGGGNQTNSLRVKDSLNREYNFRMLRKDAVQFLQATAYKDQVIEKAFEDTFAEEMIQDFYTASHPFAFLAIPPLADAAGVLHTNPEIYYLPRQPALGDYNSVHGDEIYMIEERPEENWLNHKSFGTPNHDIQSTAGMFDRLRRDEKYKLDEEAYIRARIFDMLIGDWDRHNDQWRWAEIEQENGNRIFKPIPRDRDQVFSNFDGSVFDNLRGIIGFLNQFGRYNEDIRDVEWFNRSAANLDRALVQNSGRDEWLEQAEIIQKQITDQVIAEAFERLPKEAQGETTEEIISKLKGRKANLIPIIDRYYEIIAKRAIMTGTDKDEYIDIKRLPDGDTEIIIYRNKDGERAEIVNQRVFRKGETKEVWVYGLDDEDEFSVDGSGSAEIDVKLIGGQNNDIYDFKEGNNVKVYDYRSKSNTVREKAGAKIFLTDNYDINVFDKNSKISNKNSLLPFIGYNPDDGIILGFRNTYTVNNLVRKPFTSKHEIGGEYFFATEGFEISYHGEFAHAERKFNMIVGTYFSSPRNTTNYFGIGNETPNFTKELSKDYNRVRVSALGGEIGLLWRNPYGNQFSFKALVEGLKVEDTRNRVITNEFEEDSELFERTYFAGLEGKYNYLSLNSRTNPSKGLSAELTFGSKTEIQNGSRTFLYLNPFLELFTPLTADQKLVLNPQVMAELNFFENFSFYHAATLGGQNGLRSFRHERFTGTKAFAAGSDLRYSFNTIRNDFLPIQIGILGGYDVGRVWAQNESSTLWHQSYGGGLWITVAKAASAEFSLFHGVEGLRFSFGFRFGL